MASLISNVNYVLRRFREDPECRSPGPSAWAKSLKIDRFEPNMAEDDQRELARTMLKMEDFTRSILVTNMLGRGSLNSAIDLIVRTNIELVPLEAYSDWLAEQWGIDSTTRANESRKVLRTEDLDESLLSRVHAVCEEDFRLHERIMKAWRRVGGTHIFGSDLLDD
ncbi:hypothetical protein [Roseiarcus fermentans]|nr:hypothetical protein [Roseiarcus fermentans]